MVKSKSTRGEGFINAHRHGCTQNDFVPKGPSTQTKRCKAGYEGDQVRGRTSGEANVDAPPRPCYLVGSWPLHAVCMQGCRKQKFILIENKELCTVTELSRSHAIPGSIQDAASPVRHHRCWPCFCCNYHGHHFCHNSTFQF